VAQRAIAAGLKPTADQITRTYNATAARQAARDAAAIEAARQAAAATRDGTIQIVAAIRGMKLSVSAADTTSAQNNRQRTVRPHGPRNTFMGARELAG
jgi:hypothetical protein